MSTYSGTYVGCAGEVVFIWSTESPKRSTAMTPSGSGVADADAVTVGDTELEVVHVTDGVTLLDDVIDFVTLGDFDGETLVDAVVLGDLVTEAVTLVDGVVLAEGLTERVGLADAVIDADGVLDGVCVGVTVGLGVGDAQKLSDVARLLGISDSER